jgi:hypothetical protein
MTDYLNTPERQPQTPQRPIKVPLPTREDPLLHHRFEPREQLFEDDDDGDDDGDDELIYFVEVPVLPRRRQGPLFLDASDDEAKEEFDEFVTPKKLKLNPDNFDQGSPIIARRQLPRPIF